MKKIFQVLKKEWPIILIVLTALFFRLYRISSYMTFLGDEGRDALVWLRMMGGKFTLIGPQTSIGNMYLGPLYYYLMFPFYLLLGTIGPSIGVALFAGATTFLLWFCGREWFSNRVGLLAAFFYSVSPVAIVLSRSSWNPNVMPFFSLLIVWGIWQFWQKDKYYWLAIEGILLSFAVQSHYLGILLALIVGLFFIIKLITLIKGKSKNINKFLVNFALCILHFALLTVLPLIWFDLRHNFINYQAFYKFFSERQTTINFRPYKAIPQVWPLWRNVVTRLLAGKNEIFGFWLSLMLGLVVIVNTIYCLIVYRIKHSECKVTLLIYSYVIIGFLGMGLYKQHIYDHYFGFLFPAIFLAFSLNLDQLWKRGNYLKVSSFTLFIAVTFLSFSEIPLKYSPGSQMDRVIEIDRKIVEESKSRPFNFGLIAKRNYDTGYRYFLEKWGRKAVEIDAQRSSETITNQLFVVCEEIVCEPVTHPQAEIANFGWSKIEKEWSFPWGVKLFKLVHFK